MMEPQAIADIEKSITLNSLDSYGQRNKAVDKGRLHAIIGDEHSREDVDAVIAQVNEKYGTDFAVISAHARTGRFQVTTHLYLVSGGATEVSG